MVKNLSKFECAEFPISLGCLRQVRELVREKFRVPDNPSIGGAGRHRCAVGLRASWGPSRGRHGVGNGGQIEKMSARQRHKIRIAAKKLRYGSEFFAALFQSAKAEKKQTTIAEIDPGNANSGVAFFAGVALGREEAKVERLMGGSQKALKDLKGARVFW